MPAFNITNPVSVGAATKKDHYDRAFDNTLALRAGDWALTGQAAGKFPYYDGASWLAKFLPNKPYAVTTADVGPSSTAEITALTFDIPANEWADGDVIMIVFTALSKNNNGGTPSLTRKLKMGGASFTLATAGFTDSATEYKNMFSLTLMRVGADVWIRQAAFPTGWAADQATSAVEGTMTPANFTSILTVQLTGQFSGADATTYVKPQKARAWRQTTL